MLKKDHKADIKKKVLGSTSSAHAAKGLKLYNVVSGADGADSGPVIKASQEKRTRHWQS